MRVFITGGSGFVGREIVSELLRRNHSVTALARSSNAFSEEPGVTPVSGDITDVEPWIRALENCDAVIHLVGIIREFPGKGITFDKLHTEATRNILRAARQCGVQRYIQMSANGTRENAVTDYHRTKWAAEELVRSSGLDWTIFRPSLIFGPQDEFVNMLATLVKRLPVVPVMGDGTYRMQPVAVENVAVAFVSALERPETVGKTYHCCGPDRLSYNQLLDEIARTLNKASGARKLHQPLCLMKPLVSLFETFPLFPMTRDQLEMLLEENICEDNDWAKDFPLQLTPFSCGIAGYLTPGKPAG